MTWVLLLFSPATSTHHRTGHAGFGRGGRQQGAQHRHPQAQLQPARQAAAHPAGQLHLRRPHPLHHRQAEARQGSHPGSPHEDAEDRRWLSVCLSVCVCVTHRWESCSEFKVKEILGKKGFPKKKKQNLLCRQINSHMVIGTVSFYNGTYILLRFCDWKLFGYLLSASSPSKCGTVWCGHLAVSLWAYSRKGNYGSFQGSTWKWDAKLVTRNGERKSLIQRLDVDGWSGLEKCNMWRGRELLGPLYCHKSVKFLIFVTL